MTQRRVKNGLLLAILAIGSLSILIPMYFTVSTALKNRSEMRGNQWALPEEWRFENFAEAIEVTGFWQALGNSVLITASVVVLTVLSNSLVGYAIARNMHRKPFKVMFYYLLSAMFIPFAIVMLPLVKQMAALSLDGPMGLILLYVVYNLSFNVLLYTGYVQTIPMELEESAVMDGASTWVVFWRIVFPLMLPVNATVAILTALHAWNDFLLPLVILSDRSQFTLPLVQYAFQGQFSTDYNLAFASYLMALAPMLLIYLFAQRWIIGGVMRGSVKG